MGVDRIRLYGRNDGRPPLWYGEPIAYAERLQAPIHRGLIHPSV